MVVQHRQLSSALIGDPLGAIGQGILDLGLGQVQTPGFPTHDATDNLMPIFDTMKL